MFSSSSSVYSRLKTYLSLVSKRANILLKKRSEMSMKKRGSIAELIEKKKITHARINVEQIIREDYYCEVLEFLSMYCDLISTRLSILETKKELDPSLIKAVSTVLFLVPHIYGDITEMKKLKSFFTEKFGEKFVRSKQGNLDNEADKEVCQRIQMIEVSPKLIEKYLVQIAKSYSVDFEPDLSILENKVEQKKEDKKSIEDNTSEAGFKDIGFDLAGLSVQNVVEKEEAKSNSSQNGEPPSYNDATDKVNNLPNLPGEEPVDFEDLEARFNELRKMK
uniref:IST1 homolog n=1 Tax=Lepeophtheirus salmonis TaxID=72036 RepID=D3PJN2_LEPSM|nr:IST1 homolog [Lepeophtheirus salmonis]